MWYLIFLISGNSVPPFAALNSELSSFSNPNSATGGRARALYSYCTVACCRIDRLPRAEFNLAFVFLSSRLSLLILGPTEPAGRLKVKEAQSAELTLHRHNTVKSAAKS